MTVTRTQRDEAANLAFRMAQKQSEEFGELFSRLYTYGDRMLANFFPEAQEYPVPFVIMLDRDPRRNKAHFVETSMSGIRHVVNLDPWQLTNGWEAAEYLTHELVHFVQWIMDEPTRNNYHSKKFHGLLLRTGIVSEGPKGKHVRTNVTWDAWTDQNADLELANFILPGADAPERRKLKKYVCSCGHSFRSRKSDLRVLCLDCDGQFVLSTTRVERDR